MELPLELKKAGYLAPLLEFLEDSDTESDWMSFAPLWKPSYHAVSNDGCNILGLAALKSWLGTADCDYRMVRFIKAQILSQVFGANPFVKSDARFFHHFKQHPEQTLEATICSSFVFCHFCSCLEPF